jgi:hypothetical protein
MRIAHQETITPNKLASISRVKVLMGENGSGEDSMIAKVVAATENPTETQNLLRVGTALSRILVTTAGSFILISP